MDRADIDNRFDYHRPSDELAVVHQQVRESMKLAAMTLNKLLPEGREKSLAMTNLEQAMFWGNAAIARTGAIS